MRISPPKICKATAPARGFTLVELLIVFAIIAIIFAMALPRFESLFRVSIQTVTVDIASSVRDAAVATLITGKIHRVVYDISKGEYWVEKGPAELRLQTSAGRTLDEKRIKMKFKKDEEEEKSAFTLDKATTREKRELPPGVRFKDIVTEQSPEPIDAGQAYTHFFPHGITEKTLIHLIDSSDHEQTLIISAMVGKTHIEPGYFEEKSNARR